jgi:mRNA-degrading endonuclease RelE of RelBE toxin-antitoxin system
MRTKRHTVELVREAEKDLKRLRPWTDHVVQQLLVLEEDPFAGHPLTGVLRGCRSLEISLQGGGEHRAVYTIVEDDLVCVILIVGPHQSIYERAERRYRAWLKRAELQS